VGGHDGGLFQHLFRAHFQLVLHMQGRCGDEQMDARVRGMLNSIPGAVDILVSGAGEGSDGTIFHSPGDFRNGFEKL